MPRKQTLEAQKMAEEALELSPEELEELSAHPEVQKQMIKNGGKGKA